MNHQLVIKGKVFGEGRPVICLPVMKTTREEIIEETKRLVSMDAEMIEWRVDAFSEVSSLNAIRELLNELKPIVESTPFVYTFRSKEQGGLVSMSDTEIYDIHQVAAETKVPDFIDIEFFASKQPVKEIKALHEMGAYVIASHHDFNETPPKDVMNMLLSEMQGSGADIVKLAVMPGSSSDVLDLLNATVEFKDKYEDTPLITMSMGKMGMISRVSGEVFGSCVTFGNPGEASAPGQIEVSKLTEMLAILSLS